MPIFEKIRSIVKEAVQNVDPILFLCSIILSVISIVTIFGAVDNFGMSKLKMQVFIFIIGTVLTFVLAFFDYRVVVERFWMWMLAGSVALLALTLVFGVSGVGMETSNKSWLMIPGTSKMIQPSEFVKFAYICTFSYHLHKVQDHINKPLTVLFLMIHAGIVIGMILLSGDLGVALVYLVITALMLYSAGLHLGYFAVAILLVVLVSPYLWDKLSYYQRMRIVVGFSPELDPDVFGWQPLLSKTAVMAGGIFGKGLMSGGYYEDLPASHTDFIFATICEKFGFLGGAAVIGIFIVMILRIFKIARQAQTSDLGGLICAGIGGMLVAQILENIGMCLAMLPVVGITLPFLSCGGSSMLATFMMFGLLHSVSAHSDGVRRTRQTERFMMSVG